MINRINEKIYNQAAFLWILPISAAWKIWSSTKNSSDFKPSELIIRRVYFRALKTVFKSVYGNSLAAHMKEHRMEKAVRLLSETGLPIAEIARRVGYDSQSKFTAAFKSSCGVLPTEYRKTAQSQDSG